MGWASGSELAEKVWNLFEQIIPEMDRPAYALFLTNIFEEHDCDTMSECEFVNQYIEYGDNGWKIKR